MTTTPIPPAPANRTAVRNARRQWHRATQAHGPSDEWDRRVIDRVIAHLASLGEPFSANEARELLPAVRQCLVGRAFERAQREGWLQKIGYTPSTLASTKGHPVAVYAPSVSPLNRPPRRTGTARRQGKPQGVPHGSRTPGPEK